MPSRATKRSNTFPGIQTSEDKIREARLAGEQLLRFKAKHPEIQTFSKKKMPPLKERLWRIGIHIPAGMVGMMLTLIHPACNPTFTFMFWRYQYNEDQHLKDGAWMDIAGYLWGYFIIAPLVYYLQQIT